jgi:uncharacterized PurR-regulated membrane protein YhhQ (DUF165 family)
MRVAPRLGAVKVYEYRNVLQRTALDAVAAPYRAARRAQDPLWPPPARAYGGPDEPEEARRKRVALGLAALRLIVPVALVLVLLGASYLYADDLFSGLPVSIRGMGLAVSDLILPGAWTCIHLINRRYGPGYACAQLLAALVIAAFVLLFNLGIFGDWVTLPSPVNRAVLSFGAAFLTANFVAIIFFDAARGPRWWTAPFAGSFAASFVFSAIYFPAAFAGLDRNWTASAAVHFTIFFVMSVLLLMPYWLLRPAMRPIDGRNGY